MTHPIPAQDDYYFVPLGRERGGLLDVLGLPPGAEELVVGDALVEHRKKLKTRTKKLRKELAEQIQQGAAPPETLEARTAEWRAEEDEALLRLNELEARHDQECASRREAERAGRRIAVRDPWQILIRDLAWGPETVRALTARLQPFTGVGVDEATTALAEGTLPGDATGELDAWLASEPGFVWQHRAFEAPARDALLEALGLPLDANQAVIANAVFDFRRKREDRTTAQWLEAAEQADQAKTTPPTPMAHPTERRAAEELQRLGELVASYDRECTRSRKEPRSGRLRAAGIAPASDRAARAFARQVPADPGRAWIAGLRQAAPEGSAQAAWLEAFARAADSAWGTGGPVAGPPPPRAALEERRRLFDDLVALACAQRVPPEALLALLADLLPRAEALAAPASRAAPEPRSPAALLRLLAARDLAVLLAADLLWSRAGHVHRAPWAERIETWGRGLLGCFQAPRRDAAASPAAPAFPALCTPTRLSIDALQKEDIEDLSKGPARASDQDRAAMLKALLGAMLADDARSTRAPEPRAGSGPAGQGSRPSAPGPEPPPDFDKFRRMLEAMAAMEEMLAGGESTPKPGPGAPLGKRGGPRK